MKKIFLILMFSTICEQISAYSNCPVFPNEVQKYWLSLYEAPTVMNVLQNLVGDTLQITHSPIPYYDKKYSF